MLPTLPFGFIGYKSSVLPTLRIYSNTNVIYILQQFYTFSSFSCDTHKFLVFSPIGSVSITVCPCVTQRKKIDNSPFLSYTAASHVIIPLPYFLFWIFVYPGMTIMASVDATLVTYHINSLIDSFTHSFLLTTIPTIRCGGRPRRCCDRRDGGGDALEPVLCWGRRVPDGTRAWRREGVPGWGAGEPGCWRKDWGCRWWAEFPPAGSGSLAMTC